MAHTDYAKTLPSFDNTSNFQMIRNDARHNNTGFGGLPSQASRFNEMVTEEQGNRHNTANNLARDGAFGSDATSSSIEDITNGIRERLLESIKNVMRYVENNKSPSDDLTLLDVHGGGAQRSEFKVGDSEDYPEGHGPQGDQVKIDNFVWLVADDENAQTSDRPYTVVDTGQTDAYDEHGNKIDRENDQSLSGQDGDYQGAEFSYSKNSDGSVTDNTTGLTWKTPEEKMTLSEAEALLETEEYADYQMASIKQVYSLADFNGQFGSSPENSEPFIDTEFFPIDSGDGGGGIDGDAGNRWIDGQILTATQASDDIMYGDVNGDGESDVESYYGFNPIDGRIKAYPATDPASGGENEYYVMFVKDNTAYGENDFQDNGDGTITDDATGLVWSQNDSGAIFQQYLKETGGDVSDFPSYEDGGKLDWKEALDFVEWANENEVGGRDDWRLPNAKELNSIVDYSSVRSSDTANSSVFDSLFNPTEMIELLDGKASIDYGYYWSSTTILEGIDENGDISADRAVYFAGGKADGWMPTTPGPKPGEEGELPPPPPPQS